MRRFNPEKALYKIQYGNKTKVISFVFLLLVVSIISYSFALYQVRYSKRIIYTKVAPFSNYDIELSVYLDGEKTNDFLKSEDGYYFDGLDCETEGVTTATWNYKLWALDLISTEPNKCNVNFTKSPSLLTERIKLMNDHKEDNIATLADDDPDNNIRYIGANPDNYIWFNCDNYENLTQETAQTICEKWRIIGLMNDITIIDGYEDTDNPTKQNLVKIIRKDSFGNLVWWDDSSTNNWVTSSLQKLLNVTYYNGGQINNIKGITASTRNIIEQIRWNIGGWDTSEITVPQFYEKERGTATYNYQLSIWDGYIGLMYASDYGYSTSGLLSSTTANREGCLAQTMGRWSGDNYRPNCAGNSWLFYNGQVEWILPPCTYSANCALNIDHVYGYVSRNTRQVQDVFRPSLYLKSNVKIIDGNGSEETPYILAI